MNQGNHPYVNNYQSPLDKRSSGTSARPLQARLGGPMQDYLNTQTGKFNLQNTPSELPDHFFRDGNQNYQNYKHIEERIYNNKSKII
jgi:hypothetical protein